MNTNMTLSQSESSYYTLADTEGMHRNNDLRDISKQ